jgi:hypothetical protein
MPLYIAAHIPQSYHRWLRKDCYQLFVQLALYDSFDLDAAPTMSDRLDLRASPNPQMRPTSDLQRLSQSAHEAVGPTYIAPMESA